VEVVAIVVGTGDDPQNDAAQAGKLAAAGAVVVRTVNAALAHVANRLAVAPAPLPVPVNLDALTRPFAALNVGLESFQASLAAQGAPAVQVDWRPPAGGNQKLMGILERLKGR
jgi:FdrA protein